MSGEQHPVRAAVDRLLAGVELDTRGEVEAAICRSLAIILDRCAATGEAPRGVPGELSRRLSDLCGTRAPHIA